MLDINGYNHTLTIYNNYRFYTATMVARTRLNVTFIHTFFVLLNLNNQYALKGWERKVR
jgi:hypothetical protein